MKTSRSRLSGRKTWLSLVALAPLVASPGAWAGYGNLVELQLVNGDPKNAVNLTISQGSCAFYRGPATLNIQAGQSYRIGVTHDPSGSCNSYAGNLIIGLAGSNLKAYFAVNENGPMYIDPRPPTTALVGTFSRVGGGSQGGGEFRWVLPVLKRLAAVGKPKGRWDRMCSHFCNMTIRNEVTTSTSTDKTSMQETTRAISVALEGGVEFEGFSAKTTVTANEEQKLGSSLSQMTASGTVEAREQKVGYSDKQMLALNIFSIWQWQVTTVLNDGNSSLFKTNMYTCTRDGNPPRYLPNSLKDQAACKKQ